MARGNTNSHIEPVYREIGRRMRWLRDQKGWSTAATGDKIPVAGGTFSQWEKGLSRPGVAELLKLAHAFGVEISLLLSDLDIKDCSLDPRVVNWRKERGAKRVATLRAQGRRSDGKPIKTKGER